MLIDPFTVLAQIVNFLILVALLKHFLYGPITRAMTQREQTIAHQLEQAAQQEAVAQQEADRLQQMQQDFATHRDQRLTELRSHLQDERLTLLAQAKDEVSQAKNRWYQALEQEKTGVLRRFRQQAAYQLAQTVRQVLTDLADADLEQQVVKQFLTRLQQLPESEQQGLQQALILTDGAPVVMCSSLPLSENLQRAIADAVQAAAPHPLTLTFETNPDLGCGIELRIPGYKLDWNLAAYLNNLEQTLALTLENSSASSDGLVKDQSARGAREQGGDQAV
ncbi:MAG: ATP F0F1 synthase subunit B [Leptolyngbya sp. SIOISBB]|nr:ATP F0F1 synthase subunit B [Leptolyngbya sp. SIOISBB]